MIKGGGGALLREKIVATASDQMVVIADDSKLVTTLGLFPLPVEVVRFGLIATMRLVEAIAAETGCHGAITLRPGPGDAPFVTDQGNLILDCAFGSIPEPEVLAFSLKRVPGRGRARPVSWARRFGYRGGKRRGETVAPPGSLTPSGRVRLRSVRHWRGLRRGPRRAAFCRARREASASPRNIASAAPA